MNTTPWDPAASAAAAAAGIRKLNHDTIGNAGDLPVAAIADAVAELLDLARGLPQALDQLGRHLEALDNADRIRLDLDGAARFAAPAAAVAEVVARLVEAAAGAGVLASSIGEAHEITSTLAEVRP